MSRTRAHFLRCLITADKPVCAEISSVRTHWPMTDEPQARVRPSRAAAFGCPFIPPIYRTGERPGRLPSLPWAATSE
jgi:hypothetical protein